MPGTPPDIVADVLAALVAFTLATEGVRDPVGVSVVVVDDATIQALHARHMGLDTPTDVLTFDLAGDGFVSGEPAPMLGEVIVSHETALVQAADAGHSLAHEVAFLVVHGVLHLLGHDDATPAQRAAMHAHQEALLTAFDAQ
ncbi:MAG: rRNA maturation RNase YbeY [Chloroflexi bacterium]|nr:rRNA maturation RNase YbeY [Chloroflexota bacterium]